MKEKIVSYLEQIEKEKNIQILLACETGSRAWGFPSPDSDYDVRIIYKHTKDWYLALSEKKDAIDMMLENNDIDISGWDLRKSLRLLKKSNPPLLERIQSPIIYKANEQFLKAFNELAVNCYSKIATMHHYLSMSKKIFEELQGQQEYKLKKLFYALRTATACKWILEKEEIPPIVFKKMLDGLSIDQGLIKSITTLITLKATQSETYLHTGEKAILGFIAQNIEEAEHKAKSLTASNIDHKSMDDFFIKTIS